MHKEERRLKGSGPTPTCTVLQREKGSDRRVNSECGKGGKRVAQMLHGGEKEKEGRGDEKH